MNQEEHKLSSAEKNPTGLLFTYLCLFLKRRKNV